MIDPGIVVEERIKMEVGRGEKSEGKTSFTEVKQWTCVKSYLAQGRISTLKAKAAAHHDPGGFTGA